MCFPRIAFPTLEEVPARLLFAQPFLSLFFFNSSMRHKNERPDKDCDSFVFEGGGGGSGGGIPAGDRKSPEERPKIFFMLLFAKLITHLHYVKSMESKFCSHPFLATDTPTTTSQWLDRTAHASPTTTTTTTSTVASVAPCWKSQV